MCYRAQFSPADRRGVSVITGSSFPEAQRRLSDCMLRLCSVDSRAASHSSSLVGSCDHFMEARGRLPPLTIDKNFLRRDVPSKFLQS